MNKFYYSFTSYKDAEDFKRLDFIVNSIRKFKNLNPKILDIGCGNGNISMALGSLNFDVVGVDMDVNSIKRAQGNNHLKNVHFEVQDVNTLNIREEYDIIICSEVLEHLNDPGNLLKSISRILKQDGILIATVPNGQGPREILITRPVQWMQKKGIGSIILKLKNILGYSNKTLQSSNPDLTHVQFFSKKSFKTLLKEYGFIQNAWSNANFIEKVFPFSLVSRRAYFFQKLDCAFADLLPTQLSSGFYTVWVKD